MGDGTRRPGRYWYYLRSIWTLLRGFSNPIMIARLLSPVGAREPRTILLRQGGLRFRVRGAMDAWSVKEACLDRVYERYGFAVRPGWTVVDIGAGIGEYTLVAARAGARVVAFEPAPASFALLEQNLALNGASSVHAIQAAVGATTGRLRLDTSGDPVMYRSDAELGNAGTAVRSLSLAAALAEGGVERVDLLKLDCEGAEYDILLHAPPEVLARVPRIVLEYHDLDAQRHHRTLAAYLRGAGYSVETFQSPVLTWIGFLRAARPDTGDGVASSA